MIDNSRRNNPFKLLYGLNKVHTKNSSGVTWSGSGTAQDPLMVSVTGSGGGGGTAAWGNITGTLADQSDLQSALTSKANVSDVSDIQSDILSRVKVTTVSDLQTETSTSTTARYYVTDSGKEGYFYYDSTDISSSDDGVMVLVSGTRRYKRIVQDGVINVLWWGADNTGTNDTAAAQNAMFTWVQNNPMKTSTILFPKGTYRVDSTVELPHKINTTTESIRINILGYGARIFSTVEDITLWSRMPADQSEALNVIISNWIGHIRGFVFDGLGTAVGVTNGQTGLKIGALYSWTVEDCNFNKFDTGLQVEFGLSCRFINLRASQCNVDSFVGRHGTWSGASTSNSAFNANTIENCRSFNKSGGANSALNLIAGNGNYVRNFISEGAKPVYHIIIESNASTVIKQNILDNIWIESNGGTVTTSTNFKVRNVGTTYIKNVHMDYADILFDSSNSLGSSNIIFDGIHYTGALPTPCFKTGTASQTLGYNISFRNIGSGVLFFNKLYDPTSWVDGVVPFEIFYDYDNGDKVFTSSSYITFRPGQSLSGQESRFYGKIRTFGTGGRQYKHEYDSTNYFEIETGAQGTTNFYAQGTTASWGFVSNGASRLSMDANNAVFNIGLLPATDNTRDLGRTSGPLRWRTGYFATSLGLGVTTTPTSFINFGASTTAKAHISLTAGVDKTSPTNGDLWYNGTNLYFRSGGVSVDLLSGGGGDMSTTVYDSDEDGIIDTNALPEFVLSSTYFDGDGSSGTPITPKGTLKQIADTTPSNNDFLKYNSSGTTWEVATPAQVKTALSLNNVENTALSTWTGSSNITSIGTLTSLTTLTIRTLGNAFASNFYVSSADGISNTAATDSSSIFSGATNAKFRILMRGGFNSTLVANDSYASLLIGTQTLTEAGSGTHAMLSQLVIKPLAVTAGAATVTDASTVYITGASNATVTGQNNALRLGGSTMVENTTEPPTPTGGGVFWVEGGALKFKGSSGTVTTIAPA